MRILILPPRTTSVAARSPDWSDGGLDDASGDDPAFPSRSGGNTQRLVGRVGIHQLCREPAVLRPNDISVSSVQNRSVPWAATGARKARRSRAAASREITDASGHLCRMRVGFASGSTRSSGGHECGPARLVPRIRGCCSAVPGGWKGFGGLGRFRHAPPRGDPGRGRRRIHAQNVEATTGIEPVYAVLQTAP